VSFCSIALAGLSQLGSFVADKLFRISGGV
jgi:hypothetical protein